MNEIKYSAIWQCSTLVLNTCAQLTAFPSLSNFLFISGTFGKFRIIALT